MGAAGPSGDQPARTGQDQARNRIRGNLAARPQADEFGQGRLAFAERHRHRAGGEIDGRVVGGVGPVHRDAATSALRRGDHGQGGVAADGGAHLGQEVEVVLDDHDHAWPILIERGFEVLDALSEGGVEQSHLVAVFRSRDANSKVDIGEYGFIFTLCLASLFRKYEWDRRITIKILRYFY